MTRSRSSDALCGLLRRTYALTAPLLPIGRYVIGDAGLRALYPKGRARGALGAGEGARLLVRDTGAGVRACIYYPDAMIRRLEDRPPQRGLDDDNVDAFAVLVEELDHLLVGRRAGARRARRVAPRARGPGERQQGPRALAVPRPAADRASTRTGGRGLRHQLFHERDVLR